MSNYYNLDGIKTALQKDIATCRVKLEAWRGVTYPTKKDGKPFAVMSKNIDGAKYTVPQYGMTQPGEYILSVTTWGDGVGYISDDINLYSFADELDDVKKGKPGNILPKVPYLRQVYRYDLDDIKQAVNKRIEYFEKHLEKLERQLEKAEEAYNVFLEKYREAVEALNAVTQDCTEYGTHSSLYYSVKDTIENSYKYR